METEKKPLVQVKNLKKYFNTGHKEVVKALDNVSFDIYEGETVGLVGESGCGKTTCGRIILGLYDKTDGQVLYRLHLGQTALLPQAPQPFIEYHLYPPPLMDIVSLPPAASFLPAGARTLRGGSSGRDLFGMPEVRAAPACPFWDRGAPRPPHRP